MNDPIGQVSRNEREDAIRLSFELIAHIKRLLEKLEKALSRIDQTDEGVSGG